VQDYKWECERKEGKRKPPTALYDYNDISSSFTLFSQGMCYRLPHFLKHEPIERLRSKSCRKGAVIATRKDCSKKNCNCEGEEVDGLRRDSNWVLN
jgi:hypothetical protein